jgi:hypothetical protein
MTKEKVMEELTKRLTEAAGPPADVGQNKEPVWHEAGAGMNVEQLRIGEKLTINQSSFFFLMFNRFLQSKQHKLSEKHY